MDGRSTRIVGGRRHVASSAAIAITVLTLVIAALVACDPGYNVTVRNETDVPLMLSGRSSPSEKRKKLAPNQEIGLGFLNSAPEPALDIVATDPEGRRLHIVLTRAELEGRNFEVVIRHGDFASSTPTAPK